MCVPNLLLRVSFLWAVARASACVRACNVAVVGDFLEMLLLLLSYFARGAVCAFLICLRALLLVCVCVHCLCVPRLSCGVLCA